MDVESFEDGYVSKLLVPEGGSVKVSSSGMMRVMCVFSFKKNMCNKVIPVCH